jgi:hypothetical protein
MTKNKKQDQGSQRRTAAEKARIIAEADNLTGEELGAFLRREGVHPGELKLWRDALDADKADRKSTRRIRDLERELRRKEKALAEAAALLVLKKKAEAILGDEDDEATAIDENKS